MSGENLSLKIIGTLDVGATKPIIDAKIQELEKQINKLNLTIKIDDNVMKTLNDFSTQMSKIGDIAKNTGKVIQESINPDGSRTKTTYYNGLKGEFSQIETAAKESGEAQLHALEEVQDGFSKITSEAQRYNAELKQIGETVKLTNDTGTQSRTVKLNGDGGVLGYTDTTNYTKEEQQAKQLENEVDKLTQSLKKMYDQGMLNEQFFENFNKAINSAKNIEEVDKLESALQRVNQFAKNQSLQQNLLSQSQSLLGSGKNVDSAGLTSLISNLNNVNLSAENATRELSLMQSQLKGYQASVTVAAEETMALGDVFKSVYSNLTMYFGGITLLFQTFSSFKEGINTLNDVNRSLTTISMITHQTQEQVAALGDQYQKLGNDLSVSTTEIAASATELYRQGLSIDEVNSRLKLITEFSKVAGLSAQDATTYITAATNSMRVSAQQATDVFASLGHSSGVNAGYIASAFQKVGGTAGALNLDFNKVASWISTVGERTKESSETIGQSVKSILARVQSLREKGFDETDGTKVNAVAKSLSTIGVQLVDAKGQFRNFGNVMDDIGAKWSGLDSRTKAYIATTVAGTYQQSRFLDLMQGYSRSVDLYNTALNSSGAVQQKFNDWQQGTEAKMAKLQNTIQGFWMSAINSKDIQSVITSLTTVSTALTTVVDHIGLLPTALGLAGTAFLLFNTKARTAVGTLQTDLVKGIRTSVSELGVLATVAKGTGVTLDFFWGKLKSIGMFVWNTALPVAAIMGIGYAIEKVTGFIEKQKEEQEKLKSQEDDLVSSYSKNKDKVNELVSEYQNLANARQNGKLNTSQEQQYVDVQNQLAKILPVVKTGVDEKGNAIIESSTAIKEQIDLIKQQIQLEQDKQRIENPKNILQNSSDGLDFEKQAVAAKKAAEQEQQQVDHLKSIHAAESKISSEIDKEIDLRGKALLLQNQSIEKTKENATLIKNYFSDSKIDSGGITQISSLLSQIDLKGKNASQIDTYFTSVTKSVDDLDKALKKNSSEGINNAVKSLEALGLKGSQIKDILTILENKTKDDTKATQDNTQAQKDYAIELQKSIDAEMAKATIQEQTVGTTQSLINKTKDQISAYVLLSQQENLSAEQKAALADATQYLSSIYPELVQNGQLNVEQMRKETEAQDILLKAVNDVANGSATAQEIMTTNQAIGAKSRIELMSNELKALQTLMQTYEQATQHQIDMANQLDSKGFDGSDEALIQAQKFHSASVQTQKDYSNTKNSLDALIPSYDAQIKTLANLTKYQGGEYKADTAPTKSSSPKSGSGSGSASDVQIEQVDKYKVKMDELSDTLKESEFLTKNLDKTSEQYRQGLEKQSSTLKEMSTYTLGEVNALENRDSALKSQIASMGDVNRLSNVQKTTFNNLTKELQDNTNQVYQLKDAWRGYQDQIRSIATDLESTISDQIATEEQARLDILQQNIDAVSKSYDGQITQLQTQLDQLNQIADTQDRISKLNDINDQISKAQSDTRYSYITAQGDEILTYNKSQVSDLEKQRDDMLAQYQRDDLKKAIQDEIDRLSKAKDDQTKILQQQSDSLKKYWDKMVADAKAGTLSFSTLQQAWEDKSISSLVNHVNATGGQLNNLASMYHSLDSIMKTIDSAASSMNSSLFTAKSQAQSTLSGMVSDINNYGGQYTSALNNLANTSGSALGQMAQNTKTVANDIASTLQMLKQNYDQAMARAQSLQDNFGIDYVDTGVMANLRHKLQAAGIPTYHSGGIVGTDSPTDNQSLNKLFNLKPNEQIAKLLKGEVVINPNLPNVQNSMKSIMGAIGNKVVQPLQNITQNIFKDLTIKANNPQEFLAGIDTLIRSS